MLCHVYEHLLTIFVFSLHHESSLWLYDRATLRIHNGIPFLISVLLLKRCQFRRGLPSHHSLIHLHDLLVTVVFEEFILHSITLILWWRYGLSSSIHQVEQWV